MGQVTKQLSFAELTVQGYKIGEEYSIHVSGGSRPHIGCVVLAMPRPSLRDSGLISATSSVLNVAGHQDEHICRQIAETVAKKKNAVTVCTGGFHTEAITRGQIQELMDCIRTLLEEESEVFIPHPTSSL